MIVNDIASLLKETIGMDSASVGLSAIEHAIKERVAACKLQNPTTYLERVRASAAELQALVEAVVVPETWFFRDPGAFTALGRIATEEWWPKGPNPIRLLSVPSSTGEEPYSMAMTLLDAGFPADRFRIDAFDISKRALARAERAVYGRNSFRGSGARCRDRHFESTSDGYLLSATVRRQVTFQQGNLLSRTFASGSKTYDAVFCRNLLIYFDRPTQDRAVSTLGSLLKDKGLLFVGSAESGVFLNRDYVSAKLPMAFAFRRGTAPVRERKPTITKRSLPETPVVLPVPRMRPPEIVVSDDATADVWRPVGNEVTEPTSEVAKAVRLANQGRFVEAALCCEEHLRLCGPSAEAFHLLGLVRDASGNSLEAAAFYRKALYLDPNHHEAVVHLALLMDRQGQAAEARVLWNRAKRLQQAATS